jgi:hypothetical protein
MALSLYVRRDFPKAASVIADTFVKPGKDWPWFSPALGGAFETVIEGRIRMASYHRQERQQKPRFTLECPNWLAAMLLAFLFWDAEMILDAAYFMNANALDENLSFIPGLTFFANALLDDYQAIWENREPRWFRRRSFSRLYSPTEGKYESGLPIKYDPINNIFVSLGQDKGSRALTLMRLAIDNHHPLMLLLPIWPFFIKYLSRAPEFRELVARVIPPTT